MTNPLPITWPRDGLVPAVIQESTSGDVLMVGFMNETALEQTRATGFVHFWSRSRNSLWKKGETSSHVQRVLNIFINCEENSLLIEVDQTGAVCHEGYATCYYRRLEDDNSLQTVRSRIFDPLDVYTPSGGTAAITALWWGAYEFLREQAVTVQSATSRTLHGNITVVSRIQEELAELAGVLDGTHIHLNQHDDTLLEASQVYYWTAVEAIRTHLTHHDVRPDRALDQVPTITEPATAATLLRGMAARLDSEKLTGPIAHEVMSLVAMACGTLGIHPLVPVKQDVADLQQRDYLAPYFAT